MKINWKLRLKNKVTLVSLATAAIGLLFQVLGWFGVELPVSQSEIISAISVLISIFVILGIVTDPTTEGLNDSDRALHYDDPANSVK